MNSNYDDIAFLRGWRKATIIGIDQFGLDIINELKQSKIDVLDYLEVESINITNEKYLDIKNNLHQDDILFFVAEVNNKSSYECLLRLIQENSKNRKLNIVYLTGYLVDKSLIEYISTFNCSTIVNTNIVDSISYLVGSIYYPGLIALDLEDLNYCFKGIKQLYYYQAEDYAYDDVIDKLFKDISKSHNLEAIKNIFFVVDNNSHLSLKILQEIVDKIRANFSIEALILYATQDLKKEDKKYTIGIFLS